TASLSHAGAHTQPFSNGNSPDVQRQGSSPGVGNHKHTNTYSPGSCLQNTEPASGRIRDSSIRKVHVYGRLAGALQATGSLTHTKRRAGKQSVCSLNRGTANTVSGGPYCMDGKAEDNSEDKPDAIQ
ncbi:hypothetical protein JOQ06_015558, partial [Pogonophryne albipinna]